MKMMFKYFNSFVLCWHPGNQFSRTGLEAATQEARECVHPARELPIYDQLITQGHKKTDPRKPE